MKQVTYEIRGLVMETMVPAIAASCESLPGVRNVRVSVAAQNPDNATLVLTLNEAPTEALEQDLAAIMTAKGLELVLPAVSVVEATATRPAAPEPPVRPLTNEPIGEGAPRTRHYVTVPPPKAERRVGLTAAIASVITAVILSVLVTFALTSLYIRGDTPGGVQSGSGPESVFAELDVIDRLFRDLTIMDLDDEALLTAVLKSYVAATGDEYAEYLTPEEAQNMLASQKGEMSGIGISVANGRFLLDGVDREAIYITAVYSDSPAEKAGLQPGDAILSIEFEGEDRWLGDDIDYREALSLMKGEEGTICAFTAYRRAKGAPDSEYEVIDAAVAREKLDAHSVFGRVYGADATVGVIQVTGFDAKTPEQFAATVEDLKAKGCRAFVLDLRGNPGGNLTSVEDMLVYFLQEGDTMITIENNRGKKTETKLTVNEEGTVTCGTGTLTRADVGKYRDLHFVLLVNGNSASAAELFTANIRDYELGTIVGTKTYGKGIMQTTYSLAGYGYDGALKLTTAHYYPPSGEDYHKIGITPNVWVDLSAEATEYGLALLPLYEELDNQLIEAIAALNP